MLLLNLIDTPTDFTAGVDVVFWTLAGGAAFAIVSLILPSAHLSRHISLMRAMAFCVTAVIIAGSYSFYTHRTMVDAIAQSANVSNVKVNGILPACSNSFKSFSSKASWVIDNETLAGLIVGVQYNDVCRYVLQTTVAPDTDSVIIEKDIHKDISDLSSGSLSEFIEP